MSSFTSRLDNSPLDGSVAIELLETPEHENVLFLLNYWKEKCRGRPMPDREDLSPSDFARMLPNIGIAEVIDGGRDFRFRLYGSELAAMTGRDRTGELFSELEAAPNTLLNAEETRQRWFDLGRAIMQLGKPVFPKAPIRQTDAPAMIMHGIIAPVSAGGTSTVAQIVGAAFAAPVG